MLDFRSVVGTLQFGSELNYINFRNFKFGGLWPISKIGLKTMATVTRYKTPRQNKVSIEILARLAKEYFESSLERRLDEWNH